MIPVYGVFALDPGGSSAMAWARIRDEGTIAERLAARVWDDSDTVSGADWMAQARVISRTWQSFRTSCHHAGLHAFFVCEDFILTGIGSTDRSGLYPVWVAAAVVGYRNGLSDSYELGGFGPAAPVEVIWQQPSQALTYANDERLKRWGLWIKGREHERDAWRHLAHFVAHKPSQRLRLARCRTSPRARVHTHEPVL